MRMRTVLVIVTTSFALLAIAPPASAMRPLEEPPPGPMAQTISMPDIPDTTVDQPVVVEATATSLLPVSITVSGTCTLQDLPGGSLIVAVGPGECAVSANQAGDGLWLPAPTVQQTFMFLGGQAGVRITVEGPQWLLAAQGLPLRIPVRVASDDPAGLSPQGAVTVTPAPIPGGPSCTVCEPVTGTLGPDGTVTVVLPGPVTAAMPAGGYGLTVRYSGDQRYAGGALSRADVSIVPAGPVIEGDLPIVVSIGDSYISGEAGRWAGNALNSMYYARTDVGPTTYFDLGGMAESIQGCHRSANAEIHIEQAGARVTSVNLACSGAETTTSYTASDFGAFKPGLDFAQNEGLGQRGQALELYRLASANPGRIAMVVQSIGGNDFQFGPVVATCVAQYLNPLTGKRCKDLPEVRQLFETANVTLQLSKITGAIGNVDNAMSQAGYLPSQWDLLVQDYPSPIPGDASRIRYREGYVRQLDGGCGLYNDDLDYANNTMLTTINTTVQRAVTASKLPNAHFLDLSSAYVGNRLCEKGVDLVGPSRDITVWTDPNASLRTEWVAPIRLETKVSSDGPYQLQESMHPSYWGQLANQVCVKLAWNDGRVRGGSCVRTGGIYPNLDGDSRLYPVMELVSVDQAPAGDARPNG